MILTADLGACPEGSCHLRIHSYVEVLVLLDCLVALFNTVADQPREHTFEDGRANVAYPLLGDLVDLLRVWHVLPHLLVAVVEEVGYVLERESFILRHLDMSYVLCLHTYSLEESRD